MADPAEPKPSAPLAPEEHARRLRAAVAALNAEIEHAALAGVGTRFDTRPRSCVNGVLVEQIFIEPFRRL